MLLQRGTPPEQILGVQGLKARFGELPAALGGVDPYPCQLMKLLDGQNDRLAVDKEGQVHLYGLPLSVESDGTRQLMALAPAIEYVLSCGGVLLVDELENRIHPLLMQMIVSKFQSPKSNPNHAQLIFTTHNTELLDAGLIRKDQIYFVDKDKTSGSSSLYSISEFSTTTNENIRKGYLLGKYGATPDLDIEEV